MLHRARNAGYAGLSHLYIFFFFATRHSRPASCPRRSQLDESRGHGAKAVVCLGEIRTASYLRSKAGLSARSLPGMRRVDCLLNKLTDGEWLD